jgi:hypothetical protein
VVQNLSLIEMEIFKLRVALVLTCLLTSLHFVFNRKVQNRERKAIYSIQHRHVGGPEIDSSIEMLENRYPNSDDCPNISSSRYALLYLLLSKSVIGGYFLLSALSCVLSPSCSSSTYRTTTTVKSTTVSFSTRTKFSTSTLKTSSFTSTTKSATKILSATLTTTTFLTTSTTLLKSTTAKSSTTIFNTVSATKMQAILSTSTVYFTTLTRSFITLTFTTTIIGKKKRSIETEIIAVEGLFI